MFVSAYRAHRFCVAFVAALAAEALLFGGSAQAAVPPLTIYGTTAASTGGVTYTAGTIASGSGVRFDDGAVVSGSSPIAISGTLQSNLTTGTLTISNTISGTGTLAVLNAGTLKLTTTATTGYPLNNTINVSAGQLAMGSASCAVLFATSGTAAMNVSGGMVTSGTEMSFGVGNGTLATVNLSSGTIQPA